MQVKYFESAWNDIKNSPGWFGKLCLLALLNFIPVFGQIATFGYLYGWAREMAWGTHQPLPARIFSNEDGKFWRRGWFVLVLTFVLALIPSIISGIGSSLAASGVYTSSMRGYQVVAQSNMGLVVAGDVLRIVGGLGSLLLGILGWIGAMRISIYDRLSAGFQFGKIWKMLRKDTSGIMRIFGMNLLVSLIVGIVLSIIFMLVIFAVVFAGVAGAVSSGFSPEYVQSMTQAQQVQFAVYVIASSGFVGILGLFIALFASALASAFILMLVTRAMGYWTMQFDVVHWRGQDDPLPFERQAAAAAAAQAVYSTPAVQQEPVFVPENQEAGSQVAQSQPGPAAAPYGVTPTWDAPEPSQADPFMVPEAPAMPGFTAAAPAIPVGEALAADGVAEGEAAPQEAVPADVSAGVGLPQGDLGAQGAHGVEYGQAGDADVAEDGQPHGGDAE